jgi:2-desacetyl-2-hydroxyethyl bacteriochlorophyllide A dehydrogenase
MVPVPGRIEFVDRPVADPSANQVLIKTRAVSICGSDLHTFQGKHPFAPLPAAIGHELAGEVLKTGEGVNTLRPGDRVTLEPVITCGKCAFCQRGAYNLCTDISFHHRQGQGAFTPYFVADQDRVYKLPDNITFEEGALLEPLAVSIHAVKKAGIELGDSVAVFGAGPIGLMFLVLAGLQGASAVYMVDVQNFRLRQAKAFGAVEVYNNRDEMAVEAIVNRTGGLGVEASFEAVGVKSTFVQALQVLKKGGRAVMAGLHSEPEVVIPANIFVQKEISVSGTQGYCYDFQRGLELLKNGTVDLSRLITHTFPFHDLQKGFDMLMQSENEAIKVVILFND